MVNRGTHFFYKKPSNRLSRQSFLKECEFERSKFLQCFLIFDQKKKRTDKIGTQGVEMGVEKEDKTVSYQK